MKTFQAEDLTTKGAVLVALRDGALQSKLVSLLVQEASNKGTCLRVSEPSPELVAEYATVWGSSFPRTGPVDFSNPENVASLITHESLAQHLGSLGITLLEGARVEAYRHARAKGALLRQVPGHQGSFCPHSWNPEPRVFSLLHLLLFPGSGVSVGRLTSWQDVGEDLVQVDVGPAYQHVEDWILDNV